MATQDKLLKSLETLKSLSTKEISDAAKKKEKIHHCHVITEAISNSTIKVAPNFSTYLNMTFENLLALCDDPESNVRMTAEECLNRIIRALSDGSVGKVQIELHKGLRKNGPARSLRAALWRFSQLAHLIRPHKGKPYVSNVFPVLIKISERPEDQVHETLSGSIEKIVQSLGHFASDNEIKNLLKAFLKNVSNQSPTIRRTAANCLLNSCIHSRKSQFFIVYTLNCLLDMVIPLSEDLDSFTVMGVMHCFKSILPHLKDPLCQKSVVSSNSHRKEIESQLFQTEKYLQIYELCLHYSTTKDHNITNAALETLHILLENSPGEFIKVLTTPGALESRIYSSARSFSSLKLRSPSELSVATNVTSEDTFLESEMTDTIRSDIEKWIDESKLSVLNIHTTSVIPPKQSMATDKNDGKFTTLDFDSSEFTDVATIKSRSQSMGDNLERLSCDTLSEKSSYTEDIVDKSTHNNMPEVSIGSFSDSDVPPILYCARLILKHYLLSGQPGVYVADKIVRVSVKSLAMSCISTIIKLYPQLFLLFLDKDKRDLSSQRVSDVVLYKSHPDPQLRGNLGILVLNYLRSVVDSGLNYSDWVDEFRVDGADFEVGPLVMILVEGLKDESSTCVKQTLIGLTCCLNTILESSLGSKFMPILDLLPLLKWNPYWLIKVTLCDVISRISYVAIKICSRSNNLQNVVIHNVLLELLQEDDLRIRSASAKALVSIIPCLYYEDFQVEEDSITASALELKEKYLDNLCDNLCSAKPSGRAFVESMPSPFDQILEKREDRIEFSLFKIVNLLTNSWLTSSSNHLILGCIETLSLLSETYPPTLYRKAWNCKQLDLINFCVNLFAHSIIVYDLTCHKNLLKLSSNLFAGYSLGLLKEEVVTSLEPETWNIFTDVRFAKLSELYLNHMMKVLNIFHHILEELPHPHPQVSKIVLAGSPIKRRKSDVFDNKKLLAVVTSPNKSSEKDDAKGSSTSFGNYPHYVKVYEVLRSSYTNYKNSLHSESSEKFLAMLKHTLHTFAVLMEVGRLVEFRAIGDEILGYFRSTFALDASGTVQGVQQLLKCLFGTNLTAKRWEIEQLNLGDDGRRDRRKDLQGFYSNLLEQPYNEVAQCLSTLTKGNKPFNISDSTLMGYLHKKDVTLSSQGSEQVLANYIRIFEPMVIKSLRQYTVTSDVKLQCKVLQLLSQLIQLRVNYCLLDSEQIFIGFVLKQFEFIEEGQIESAHELVPKIFQFLVQLSCSKQHSKNIITMPKIIQLCDGLLASGQSPLTHAIPALGPIVDDIFLTRNKSSNTVDLETTREVVLSTLLKLCEYRQVVDLIIMIMDSCKCGSDHDKWSRWSGQVITALVNNLKRNKMRLDTFGDFAALRRLIFTLDPAVFGSFDSFLLLLFQSSSDDVFYNSKLHNRSLFRVLVSLLVLSAIKEELLLDKISQDKSDFSPEIIYDKVTPVADPLNVNNSADFFQNISAEDIFVRFIFKTMSESAKQLAQGDEDNIKAFSTFLLYCIYIFQSGSHCKITNYAVANLSSIHLDELNEEFINVGSRYPVLTILWCSLLNILNCNPKNFWQRVTTCGGGEASINQLLVKRGSVVLFCDYLTNEMGDSHSSALNWFITNHVVLVIDLYNENPVKEFISSLHRSPNSSKLFLDKLLENNCLDAKNVVYTSKILQSVENTHPEHIGSLIKLLLPKLLASSSQLAITRLVASLCSRKIELLLTMSMEDVNKQIVKEDLLKIIHSLTQLNLVKKHEALASLLNKLCTQYYDISPLDFDQKRPVNPDYIRKLQINKAWYTSQIKSKCNSPNLSRETAQLLLHLSFDEVVNLMTNSEGFCKANFLQCIILGVELIRKEKLGEEPPLVKATVDYFHREVKEIVAEVTEPDSINLNRIYDIMPSISYYVQSLPFFPVMNKIPSGSVVDFVKFGVVCLKSTSYLISSHCDVENMIDFMDSALGCANSIFGENISLLNDDISWLSCAVTSLYKLIEFLLSKRNEPLPTIPQNALERTAKNDNQISSAGQTCYKMYILVCWMCKIKNSNVDCIPRFLLKPIKSIILGLARLSVVNSYVLVPPKVWKNEWCPDLTGPFETQVPPLPIELLQDIDVLEEFIYRITLLGWTNRQQFEETWMCLLSVLCNSPGEDNDPSEAHDMVHASSLAVKAITTLLLQTLCHPIPGNSNLSNLVHVPRDFPIAVSDISSRKLRDIHETIERRHANSSHLPKLLNVFKRPNFEKHSDNYSYNQVSVKYLITASRLSEFDEQCPASLVWKRREETLENFGIDVNSCLQFLVDFYNQLLQQQHTTPLRLLHEAVRSTVIISDLFSDKSQFVWMLDILLELSKIHSVDDELLHQYLMVGICKSAAVLTPDLETYETVKKLLVQYLKSSFLPSRISCLHGLLYILEGCKLSNITIGGISEEMQIILPVAVEYVQCNLHPNGILKQCQEHTLLVWALAFYIIENIDEIHMEANFMSNCLHTMFTMLLQEKPGISIHKSFMKGLERLIICRKNMVAERIGKQVVNLALEKLKSDNPSISILGKQLLLTYMYSECDGHLKDTEKSALVQTNPDHLVQTIEKISAIFEHIKKGYIFEVEILCSVLPDILNDFFSPSDILTKVIGEFLSPQQPHPKLLSGVVFKVFDRTIEDNQLLLLQDWVIFSLPNFTQSLSLGMATWCLTCFFISASGNQWLRSVFPYVQTRVGRFEHEDRKMLCIAAADFYNSLSSDKQKTTFRENFGKVKEDQSDSLFSDLLSSL